jgi:FixJ family two-component response regulator
MNNETISGRSTMHSLLEENAEETKKIHVLIVDDEESFRKSLVYFLNSTNQYEVDSAESGQEALEALEQQSCDVLVLDYIMPGLSGLNVLQRMLELKIEIPVIMLTGAGSEYIAVEAMKLGAYDYVRKDLFDLNHLPILINSVYERFLFKKERALNNDLRKQREHSLVTAELMQNYISISTQLLNTTLAAISMIIEDLEKEIKTNLPKETQHHMEEACSTVKESYQIISFGTKSLQELTRAIFNRLGGSPEVQQNMEELDIKLKLLQEKITA